eukprot:TRINITY_DN13601_c0_g1_i1.p1 TRINITY_DN13601_c0_g1~~TRINITY_DN13601_c0_g1_i1.p1  ORF type:complete len:152 (+),score=23.56 TRINITY_DN13601_c0_g1_i1:434-889(+)
MKLISKGMYETYWYTHQGGLTEGHQYLLMDDELDEYYIAGLNEKTRTYIWNLQKLGEPTQAGHFDSSETSIDHTLYIRGQYSFCSNYEAGLRILDISNIDCQGCNSQLQEVGYFDVHPEGTELNFWGTWSNYPFYASDAVAVSSIERGLSF